MEQLGQFIMHHWELWLGLVVVLLLIFMNEQLMQKKRAKALSPASVVDMMNHANAVVIDIRDLETFRAGHIIDATRMSIDELTQERMKKYNNNPLILVCTRGIQAATAATKLRAEGVTNVMILAGGMTAWQEAGLPIIKK